MDDKAILGLIIGISLGLLVFCALCGLAAWACKQACKDDSLPLDRKQPVFYHALSTDEKFAFIIKHYNLLEPKEITLETLDKFYADLRQLNMVFTPDDWTEIILVKAHLVSLLGYKNEEQKKKKETK